MTTEEPRENDAADPAGEPPEPGAGFPRLPDDGAQAMDEAIADQLRDGVAGAFDGIPGVDAPACDEACAGEESPEPPPGGAELENAQNPQVLAETATGAAADKDLLRKLVEGALFTAPGPLSAAKLAALADGVTAADARQMVWDLNEIYRAGQHAFLVEEIAGGYRLLTRPELSERLTAFYARRSRERLSRAALETLAIVAYKQPVTRAAVENIRGVASDSVIQNLADLNLIRISGQADAPGRPMLYSTTRKFLDHFGLKSLRDLPREKDFDAMEKA